MRVTALATFAALALATGATAAPTSDLSILKAYLTGETAYQTWSVALKQPGASADQLLSASDTLQISAIGSKARLSVQAPSSPWGRQLKALGMQALGKLIAVAQSSSEVETLTLAYSACGSPDCQNQTVTKIGTAAGQLKQALYAFLAMRNEFLRVAHAKH